MLIILNLSGQQAEMLSFIYSNFKQKGKKAQEN